MPNAFIKKVEKLCGISKSDLEKMWTKAKAIAGKKIKAKNSGPFYAYAISIFKSLTGKTCKKKIAKWKGKPLVVENLFETILVIEGWDESQAPLGLAEGIDMESESYTLFDRMRGIKGEYNEDRYVKKSFVRKGKVYKRVKKRVRTHPVRLNPKQKAALRKARLKANTPEAKRRRKKALLLRKRAGIGRK